MNYLKLAFSNTIKKLQTQFGSRSNYKRIENFVNHDGLSKKEIDFITARDSFYMSTFGENQYPYIQHRGGPKGFLKIIDNKTLGFLDFTGNKQFITLGNLQYNSKASLFLMDYASRTRLKMYVETEVKDLNENEALHRILAINDYNYKAERIMLYHIKAFDWNCSQHIVPKFTQSDINVLLKDERMYSKSLEKEVKLLRGLLESINSSESN